MAKYKIWWGLKHFEGEEQEIEADSDYEANEAAMKLMEDQIERESWSEWDEIEGANEDEDNTDTQ